MAGEATEQEMSVLQQSADTVAGAVFSKEKGESNPNCSVSHPAPGAVLHT